MEVSRGKRDNREQAARWRRENPERAKESGKLYREKRKLEDPDYYRRRNYRAKYGITLEDYDLMCDLQKGVCYICKQPDSQRLAVDHCHTSGAVRKLLCKRCNLTLEHIENATAPLSEYISYINEHKNKE